VAKKSKKKNGSMVYVRLVLDEGGEVLGQLDLDLAKELDPAAWEDEDAPVESLRMPLAGAEEGMEIELTIAVDSGESI
jgi:hypothetical protein